MILISKTYWGGIPFWFRRPPENARCTSLALRTDDHLQIRAIHWEPVAPRPAKVGVVLIHTRVDFTHHYSIPRLVDAGFSVLAAQSRAMNNDTSAEYEALALDVAACVKWLRKKGGAERVVLLGNCGGGSLSVFYQAQAKLAAERRLERSPGGTPTRFAVAEMVPADGLVLVAAHRGLGHVLVRSIDAAVTDENDPFATEARLDIYDTKNGFREPPEPASYSESFLAEVRAAQRARVQRIDERARAIIRDREQFERETEASGFEARPFEERQRAQQRRTFEPVMVVHRTMANPAYCDPNVDRDPHGATREYGSLLSERPDLMNMSAMGYARTCTPRGWLSTWSALSSNVDVAKNIASVDEPTLSLYAACDREIYFDRDIRETFEASPADDKTLVRIEGARHYFEPEFGEKNAPDVDRLMDSIVPWIRDRFA